MLKPALSILAAGLFLGTAPSAQAAEIQILYNTTEIVDGDTTATTGDGTIFGVQTVGAGNLTRTFTIKNTPVTAVAATGYHFVNWSDGSTANPRTDTNVTTNRTVIANFAVSDGALFADDHVYLTLEQSTDHLGSWQTLAVTAGMVTSDGKIDVGALDNSQFYRTKINDTTFP